MAGGRPSKLTPETKEKLIHAILGGNHLEQSCQFAGIDYSSFRNWMIKGEQAKKGEFFEFFETVTRAIAEAEMVLVQRIKSASKNDWRAAGWILERRHSERWASSQRVQVEVAKEVEKELDQTLQTLEQKLPKEVYSQVLSAIADAQTEPEPES